MVRIEPWSRSTVTLRRMEGLVKKGLLAPLTDVVEWIVPETEDVPAPPDGYVVSFVHFHERGFGMPPHRFLRGLLHYYGVELQHLNPNGIQHMALFVAVCEGFLGMPANFELWKYFFSVSLITKPGRLRERLAVPVGCASIHMRRFRAQEYMEVNLTDSNKGWQSLWFYLKNSEEAPLPAFTGRIIEEPVPPSWFFGPTKQEKPRLDPALDALALLRGNGLSPIDVLGAYHSRRLCPLMERRLRMWEMKPDADYTGTVMSTEALSTGEVGQRIKEALDIPRGQEDMSICYPVPGRPTMLPDLGSRDFVSACHFSFSLIPFCLPDPDGRPCNVRTAGVQRHPCLHASIAGGSRHSGCEPGVRAAG